MDLAEQLLVQAKTIRNLFGTIKEKDRELVQMDLILSVRESEMKVKEARIAGLVSRVAELEGGKKPVIKTGEQQRSAVRKSDRHSAYTVPASLFRQEVGRAKRPSGEYPVAIRKCNKNRTVVPRRRVSGMWKATGDGLGECLCHTPGGGHSASDCSLGCEPHDDAGEVFLRSLL